MRYVGHIHILDLLDQVVIYAEVVGGDSFQRQLEPVLKMSTSVQGVGETDPQVWLQDALVALLERT
jgi:hypothetical protein